MLKVVFDTNVFLSALLFESRVCLDCLEYWSSGRIQVYSSHVLIQEIVSKLEEKGLDSYSLHNLTQLLAIKTILLQPKIRIKHSRDPKDDFLLELVGFVKANFLVTGDQDLLVIKKWGLTEIITPRQFLDTNNQIL